MKQKQLYHKRQIGSHQLTPQTLMMSYGYDPKLSEGAVKPPLFLSSTFVFATASHRDWGTMLPVNGSRIMEPFGPVCRLNPPLQLVIGVVRNIMPCADS